MRKLDIEYLQSTLAAMRDCLKEREEFISKVVEDNQKLTEILKHIVRENEKEGGNETHDGAVGSKKI